MTKFKVIEINETRELDLTSVTDNTICTTVRDHCKVSVITIQSFVLYVCVKISSTKQGFLPSTLWNTSKNQIGKIAFSARVYSSTVKKKTLKQ